MRRVATSSRSDARAVAHLIPYSEQEKADRLAAGGPNEEASRGAGQVGLATGTGAMIHAHDGAAVSEVALTGWWRRHLTHVFRFPSAA